jgi:hypothetical protein
METREKLIARWKKVLDEESVVIQPAGYSFTIPASSAQVITGGYDGYYTGNIQWNATYWNTN